VHPLAAPPRHEDERNGEHGVARLRVGRDADQRGCEDGGRRSREERTPRRRDFFVEPQEVRHEDHRKVEDLRHQEDGVHRNDRCGDERQRERERGPGPRPRRQEQIAACARRGEQHGVEDEESVHAEETHERGGDDRIDHRLAEVEAILPAVGGSRHLEKRRRSCQMNADLFPAFEKDALRSGFIDAPEALEIAPLVAEIAVVSEAQRHRDVRGLVALHPIPGAHDIHGYRGGQHEDERQCAGEKGAAVIRSRTRRRGCLVIHRQHLKIRRRPFRR
jgi:hypothetical protein